MLFHNVKMIAKTYPLLFGAGYSVTKTSLCDIMVQKVIEKREEIDWKRNSAFASFGLFYLGGVQYFLYVRTYSRWFPNAASFAAKTVSEKMKDAQGMKNLFYQVFFDQFIHHPLTYFPVFYIIKNVATADKPDPMAALMEYKENFTEDMVALWKVWLPTTILNFAFMPMWLRIPWVASTSLVWTCILSAMRGGGATIPAAEVIGPGLTGKSFELMSRTVIGPPPRLDPHRTHLLVNVHGNDRPGIVTEFTRRIYENGGSVTTSKMISLGSTFSMMMHVDCAPDRTNAMLEALNIHQEDHNLDVQVRKVAMQELGEDASTHVYVGQVRLTGEDKPGLVHALSEILSNQGLNIEHLQSEQHAESNFSKVHNFTLHCHIQGDHSPNLVALEEGMKNLEDRMGVKCNLETRRTRRKLHNSIPLATRATKTC
jgi:glycine cleavage system regulatory protein